MLLTERALNRALLARQGLLEPWDIPVPEAVERLVGLQAQAPTAPYVALWTRLAHFDPMTLGQLLLDRSCARIALMRSTIFLVTARDCLELRPVMQEASERSIASGPGKRTQGVEETVLLSRARELLNARPRTFSELGTLLAGDFPGYPPSDLAMRVRVGLPLVQVTPRGVWGQTMAATHATAEQWLGESLSERREPDDAIRRYLAAFGPATVADIAAWSGLAALRTPIERMRPTLRTFRNERGQELFDVPDGLLPDADTPVPVRIVGDFDNVLLSHRDRSRIFDETHRSRFMSVNGLITSTFLVDGFVAGTCTVSKAQGGATLSMTAFRPLPRNVRSALRAEGLRLLAFLTPAARPDVRFD
ncbi:MAG: hypothetical protein QOD87_1688 [Pseudonocardiales bacterium]|nr:hypothetical protein [Pseudonocardiales bacterium]